MRRLCERAHRTAVSSRARRRFRPKRCTSAIECLGPLEPVYDYSAIRLTREEIEQRPKNLWRYRELLPITGEPRTGFNSGFTPLVRCNRLAERLGVSELYIKDDSVNHPTLSYKDRVVSVAATRAVELGFKVLACASTGNLANSVAAHAARLGIECCVFIPDNLEAGKLLGSAIFNPTILAIAGNYDDVNRLCTQVADRYGWGFVNINLRSYYAEGAKTLRLRDRRAARLALSAASRVAGRRRHAAAAHRARAARAARDRSRRRRAAARLRGAGRRLRAGRPRARSGARASGAGAAEHDREVDRDRQSGRRLPGDPDACERPAAPARRSPTSRSSTRFSCSRRPKGIFTEPAGGTTLAGDDRSDPARRHSARRVDRRLRDRKRLQDRGSGRGPADAAGAAEPRVQGIRGVAGVAQAIA